LQNARRCKCGDQLHRAYETWRDAAIDLINAHRFSLDGAQNTGAAGDNGFAAVTSWRNGC
jgi:hypothetical protein